MSLVRTLIASTAATAILALASGPAAAEVLTFKYKGVVTKAENFDPEDSGRPPSTTHPGQAFRGSFTLNTDDIAEDELGFAVPLTAISFFLPEEGVSEDFSGPGGIVTGDSATGAVDVSGGRADYQYSLGLALNLGPAASFDPRRLFGQSGTLFFTDKIVGGFRIEGPAVIAPVPEPATWLSMLLGVGLAGLAARRRRVSFSPPVPELSPA